MQCMNNYIFKALLFILFSCYGSVYGQVAVEGTVQNQETGEPLPFAQVAFYKAGTESLSNGATTSEQGAFETTLPAGRYDM